MSELFKDYYRTYLDWQEKTQAKSPLTLKRERSSLKKLAKFFNSAPVDSISPKDLKDYALKRRTKVSTRSVNVDMIALSNVLKFAQENGLIPDDAILATERWKPLKYTAPRRSLITGDQLQALVTEAGSITDNGLPLSHEAYRKYTKYTNGDQLADLLLFMAYSGARRQAALSCKWDQVDWVNRQVTLFTKFDKKVVVDFNSKLEDHLKLMRAKRDAQYSEASGTRLELLETWLFPTPDRLHKSHLSNPQRLLEQVCAGAGIEKFRLHDLRHFFISHCIMAGVDTMTVASWVGHADGGVLIGKVYGHLNPQHKREAAQKVTF